MLSQVEKDILTFKSCRSLTFKVKLKIKILINISPDVSYDHWYSTSLKVTKFWHISLKEDVDFFSLVNFKSSLILQDDGC